jgi:hypothetical protein
MATGWSHSDPYAELRNFSELDQRPTASSKANSRPYMSISNTEKRTSTPFTMPTGMSNVQYGKLL